MSRTEELTAIFQADGWRAIRDIAISLGIPLPEGGWVDAIPLIVEAEAKARPAPKSPRPLPSEVFDQIINDPERPRSPSLSDFSRVSYSPEQIQRLPVKERPTGKYPTDFYRNNGIAFCSWCGEQYTSDLNGQRICPEKMPPDKCPALGGSL